MDSRANAEKARESNVTLGVFRNEKGFRHLRIVQPAFQSVEADWGGCWVRIGIRPVFARCRIEIEELLQVLRILFPNNGQSRDLNTAVPQSYERTLPLRHILSTKIQPVSAHSMRLMETSTADEFQRFGLVVADTGLQSSGAERFRVFHHPGEELTPNAMPLPQRANGQIETISLGPEFPQCGVGHTLALQ